MADGEPQGCPFSVGFLILCSRPSAPEMADFRYCEVKEAISQSEEEGNKGGGTHGEAQTEVWVCLKRQQQRMRDEGKSW